jgi:5-methylcytosine-specific restriction enzyme A
MTPRACLGCGIPVPMGSRCPPCAGKVAQAKRARRPYSATAVEKRRRAAAVAEWVSTHGWTCPGWGDREPHPSSDLTADHIVAVGAGGDEGGALRILCRQCNGARGARP